MDLMHSRAAVHSSNRPYYCHVEGCPRSAGGKGFERHQDLIRHSFYHRTPQYICPFCIDREFKFPRPDLLLRHVRAQHADRIDGVEGGSKLIYFKERSYTEQQQEMCMVCNDLTPDIPERDIRKYYVRNLGSVREGKNRGCRGCYLILTGLQLFSETWMDNSDNLDKVIVITWLSPRGHHIFDSTRPLHPIKVYLQQRNEAILCIEFYRDLSDSRTTCISTTVPGTVCSGPTSPLAFQKIRSWITKCETTHVHCLQHIAPLPKRVINVGLSDGKIFLYESTGERQQYITLSHCWGKKQPITTKTATLKEHRHRIEFKNLPATFQDAIVATRSLGIEYLWIDSLCIIQDDEEDWREESGKMSSIYRNSYLTIAATHAVDSSQGCFIERATSQEITFVSREQEQLAPILARRELNHSYLHGLWSSSGNKLTASRESHPLMWRGWCLSERMLSTRVLHYGAEEMVWQCKISEWCECGTLSSDPGGDTESSIKNTYDRFIRDMEPSKASKVWQEVVMEYTRCDLTRERDLLPALSGIASHLQGANRGIYVAGLWERDLLSQLCWYSEIFLYYRPSPPTAPTFSWASRIGPVSFRTIGGEATWSSSLEENDNYNESGDIKEADEIIETHVRIAEAECKTNPLNLYGEVEGGFIKLRGYLLEATLTSERGSIYDSKRTRLQGKNITKSDRIWMDVMDDIETSEREVFCLPLKSRTVPYEESGDSLFGDDDNDMVVLETYCTALILERSNECVRSFRRVALAGDLKLHLSWNSELEPREIRLE